MFWDIIQLILCGAAIMLGGSRLVTNADVIAVKTGLGKTLVGIIMIAVVTSLPELFNAVGSTVIAKQPDLVVGDVFGSLMFNMLILAAVDFFYRKKHLTDIVEESHVFAGVLSMLFTGAALAVFWISRQFWVPRIGWIGWYSFLLPAAYVLIVRLIYMFQRTHGGGFEPETILKKRYAEISLKKALAGFGVSSAIVVAAGTYLPVVGNHLAEITGISRSFIGSALIAVCTSLPELVVAFTAIRINAVHLTLGDLLGSNIFDIVIISVGDLFYTKSDLLSSANGDLMLLGIVSIVMTATLVAAFIYRSKKRLIGNLSWHTLFIVLLYVFGLVIAFKIH